MHLLFLTSFIFDAHFKLAENCSCFQSASFPTLVKKIRYRKGNFMRRFFIFTLSWIPMLFYVQLSAQTIFDDVILLKSTEMISGNASDHITGEQVTLILRDSISRQVNDADNSRILQKPVRTIGEPTVLTNQVTEYDSNGFLYYQAILAGGFGNSFKEKNRSFFKINMIHGIGFNRRGSVGLGTGLRLFLSEDITIVPVFFDARFAIVSKDVSPVLAFGVGSAFQSGNPWEETGSFVYGEFGVRFRGVNKGGVMVTLGYESFEINLPGETRGNPFTSFYYTRPNGQVNAFSLNVSFLI